jgi:hypothetical protein
VSPQRTLSQRRRYCVRVSCRLSVRGKIPRKAEADSAASDGRCPWTSVCRGFEVVWTFDMGTGEAWKSAAEGVNTERSLGLRRWDGGGPFKGKCSWQLAWDPTSRVGSVSSS